MADQVGQSGHEDEHEGESPAERRLREVLDGRMMTTRGLANMMGVSIHTAARWCREGEVESWRIGGRGAHRIPALQFDVQTIVRLAFPRRKRDFFLAAEELQGRLDSAG